MGAGTRHSIGGRLARVLRVVWAWLDPGGPEARYGASSAAVWDELSTRARARAHR